nr:hypothetical protein [Acidobacteriota bacterium]
MRKKISSVKIAVAAAFFALFAAALFFPSALKTSAFKSAENDAGDSQNCAACHRETGDLTHFNNHQKSVRRAIAETVKGDFTIENHLESADVKASMTTDGANFTVKIGDENYRVAWVVGVKYTEQYIAEKDGEFYALPVAYDLKGRRWMSLEATVFRKKDADFAAHLENWKTDCASCHQPNANDFSANSNDSGISCAACHGNAAEHLQSKNSIWARLGFQTENAIVNPRKLSSDAAMMVCAQCHARESPASEHELKFERIGERIDDAPVAAHQMNAGDAEKY